MKEPTCGNRILDPGEECDDGNRNDGDGCSASCKLEHCGNGIIDPGEECDDGNTTNGDDCEDNCTLPKCGNKIKDRGEECDDGNTDNNDDCRNDCVVNRCGDGVLNTHGTHTEACESATVQPPNSRALTSTESPTCNNDCTIPQCGDGKVNRSFTPPGAAGPEQCDVVDATGKSLDSDDADCTAHCQINVCGDGLHDTQGPNHVEACDDGNKINFDGCSNACTLPHCGDGIVDEGEECDNGAANNDNGDCRSDCLLNRCGDGHVNSLGTHKEDCDAGPVAGPGDHTVTPTETATCNINCTTPRCGDGIVNRHFTPMTLAGPLAPNPEQCDNLGRIEGNNCSADCQFERCGNGIIDPGEECDGAAGPQPCSSTCFQQKCGNGIVDPGEECDNGAANSDNSDCRSDCVINRCGDGFVNSNGAHREQCDDAPKASPHDRTVTPTETQTCNSNCTTPSCGDGIVNHAFTPLGGAGAEQCDPPGPGCTAACRLETCGNGVVDPNEQCDDGNTINGDACENDCTLPRCGNGIKDVGEECDDGNSSNSDDCTNACKFATCGDGFVRTVLTPLPVGTPTVVEQCDFAIDPTTCAYDPASKPCSVCTLACQLVSATAPFCGDGHTDTPLEACDSGNATCGACTSDCQVVISQQATGLIFAAAGKDLRANDTFMLSDGFTTPVTFEFTQTTVNTPGNVAIIFDPGDPTDSTKPGDSNSDMAAKIRDAILGARVGGLQITAGRIGSIVQLTNDRASSLGNGAPNNPKRIDPHVQTPNFAVIDMAGGLGGNCATGAPCAINADCASGSCSTTAPRVCQ